jgi:hypothetical protein
MIRRAPREPGIRAKCAVVNQFLVRANAAGVRDPRLRHAMVSKLGSGTAIEPLEYHKVNPKGGYVTLGETQSRYAIIHNVRTGEAQARRVRTSVLLPKAVIEDIYRVASAQRMGARAQLKPRSAELLRHEGTHERRMVAGVAGIDKQRLFAAWDRNPMQLQRDLGIVVGRERAKALMRSHPAGQVMEFLDTVHEERMADEAAITGRARDMLEKMGVKAINNPRQYLKAIEAAERGVMDGRPLEYRRAIMADIKMMRARMAGVKFKEAKGAGPVEDLAGRIERFSREVTGGFGGVGQYGMTELARVGGPVKVMRRAA